MSKEKGFRRVAGLTQYALAREARVPRSKIADVESGRGEYTPAERKRILTVLAVRIGKNLEALSGSLASGDEGEGKI